MTRASRVPESVWVVAGSTLTTWLAFAATVPTLDAARLSAAPILYSRDAISNAAIIQQTIEGSPLTSARFGYPFGADWSDWPTMDWGSIGIIRLLTLFVHDYALVFNLLFFIGFPLAFASAYVVSRRFDLTPAFAFVGATAFSLASYHFERLSLHGHLFLTMYWVAPIYFLLAWRLVHPTPQRGLSRRVVTFVGIATLSTFGIYYAAFGLLGITGALVYALTQRPPKAAIRAYLWSAAALIAGVAAQAIPTLLARLRLGPNPVAFDRSPLDAEEWALRPVQLLLPHLTHRLQAMADNAHTFYSMAIPGNESVMSSVGVFASLGLIVLLILTGRALAGKELDARLRFLMMVTAVFLAFATIGGFGLLLSLLGFTEIRSWNRLSIFIQFAGILTTLVALTPTAERYTQRARRMATPLVLTVALTLIWVDQTPAPSSETLSQSITQRTVTADFVHQLEQRLPNGAAIYQLPFTGFPEGWRPSTYDAYEFMKPYLESTSLRFNLGSMKGREGDRFYRSLTQRSIEKQISVARTLGFSGIYIDRMGLIDYGTRLIEQLDHLLGPGSATYRSDRRVVYFDLGNRRPAFAGEGVSPIQAEAITGFRATFPKRTLSD